MKKLSSILLIIGAGLLFWSIGLPWWGMEFHAPQYPEGLNITVYPTKMAGQMDIINSLNHYIGMKQFNESSFSELKYLKYIIVAFSIVMTLVALWRRRIGLYFLAITFSIGGVVGIWDIHRWLSKFGTELDPHAPIKIPPFVPPIIGKNRLANFITDSYFTTGSYFVGIVFLLIITACWIEWKSKKQRKET